ncbi:helix-turn-helix domain-containing protein [Streptomyces sp. CA-243310]|uniref:helix-turn-helix domain-containing protein n=1 Tax=Streptomyces sp. CA-243310 TaxID=3240056 RepID=UPI003D8D1764
MSPRREIPEGTPAGDLAVFLVGLTRGATVRALAERFGRSSSTWGNYLNGSQLIPRPLLGRLVEAYTPPGSARNVKAVRASELWSAADRERRAGPAAVHPLPTVRRDEALWQVVKYQGLAANAEKHLAELRPMLAYTQSRLENARMRLKVVGDRERVRVEHQLVQAKERLGRVRVQQERARNRRLTAEEQQQFWTTEALTAQEEINRLEREARSLVVPVGPSDADGRSPSGADATEGDDEADETTFDVRLEHIVAEGLEDEAVIEADIRFESEVAVVGAAVPPVSNVPLDRAGVDGGGSRPIRPALPYRALRTIGGALGQPLVKARLHVIAALLCLGVVVIMYGAAEGVESERGWSGVVLATLFGLPFLYGVLRFGAVPVRAARVAAVVLHLAWAVVLLLDALPWPMLTRR